LQLNADNAELIWFGCKLH